MMRRFKALLRRLLGIQLPSEMIQKGYDDAARRGTVDDTAWVLERMLYAWRAGQFFQEEGDTDDRHDQQPA